MVNPQEYLQRGRPRQTPSKFNKLGYGITRRNRKKPFIVKFKQNKKTLYVGSFKHLVDAQLAAYDYLKEIANVPL